jgi:hypothetical protein
MALTLGLFTAAMYVSETHQVTAVPQRSADRLLTINGNVLGCRPARVQRRCHISL